MTIENGDDEKILSSAGGCLCQDGPEETYILGYGRVFRFRRGEKRPGENVPEPDSNRVSPWAHILDQFRCTFDPRVSAIRLTPSWLACFLYKVGNTWLEFTRYRIESP